MINKLIKMNISFNKIRTNREDESNSCFNDSNLDNYSINTSEFNCLYLINKNNTKINNNSSNLIKIDEKKMIKVKTEKNQSDIPAKKIIKREDSSSAISKLKEVNNLRNFRKSKYLNKKRPHSGSDDDNVLRKIQVKFLSFIIALTNDIVSSLINDKNVPVPHFNDLDYAIKKVVNHKFVELLKNKTIGDIVRFKISPKIKKNESNKSVYDQFLEKCPIIKDFFERRYLSLFEEYYENKNNIFTFNKKDISLSKKTEDKTYNRLINKHFRYKEKIKNVSINYYLNSYKRLKKPKFTTSSCQKTKQNKKIE